MSDVTKSNLSSDGKGKARAEVADADYGWSKWEWDEKLGSWYRARISANGQYDYQYPPAQALSSETTTRDKQEEPTQPAIVAQSFHRQDEYGYQNEAVPNTSLEEHEIESFHGASQFIPSPSTSLDERYQIISYPSRFFKIGRVFKILWTEPAGNVSESNYQFVIPAKFGEMAFTKIRPFVVIREMQGCCLCLPLNTFSHQGTEKDRIRAEDYAAVYSMGGKPQTGASEKMTKQPFPIIIEDPKERIDPMSRLNFGQVHTIQHNLKVLRTIAGTLAQDTAGVSMAFGHLSLEPDEKATSNQDAGEEHVGKFATKYGPGTLLSDNYLGANPALQHSDNCSSTTGVVVSSGYFSEMSNTPLTIAQYQLDQEVCARQSSSSKAQISITDTAKTIGGTPGETEKLDPSFRVHKSSYFIPGKVFKVLWFEPLGAHIGSFTSTTTLDTQEKEVHASIRRFVIVANDYGHSQCLPILTYGRQGTAKAGVKSKDHAIIYTGTTPPRELPGEPPLALGPIRVIPRTPRDMLAAQSRINYAKIYTVEHNVKVVFIGEVTPSSQHRLVRDFDATWNQKKQMPVFDYSKSTTA